MDDFGKQAFIDKFDALTSEDDRQYILSTVANVSSRSELVSMEPLLLFRNRLIWQRNMVAAKEGVAPMKSFPVGSA